MNSSELGYFGQINCTFPFPAAIAVPTWPSKGLNTQLPGGCCLHASVWKRIVSNWKWKVLLGLKRKLGDRCDLTCHWILPRGRRDQDFAQRVWRWEPFLVHSSEKKQKLKLFQFKNKTLVWSGKMKWNSSKDSLETSLQSCGGQFLPRLGSGEASLTQQWWAALFGKGGGLKSPPSSGWEWRILFCE